MNAVAEDPNASEPQVLRAAGTLRILHISDLHIVENTRFTDSPWKALHNIIPTIKPDLIVATGDIADNPFSEFLSNRRRTMLARAGIWWKISWNSWNSLLEGVLSRSRAYLEDLCTTAGLDPAARLRVIPGNHDYRAQGLFGGHEIAAQVFNKVFAGLNTDLALDWRGPQSKSASFRTHIYCLDSNGPDEFSNFAAGRLENSELQRVPTLTEESGPLDEFRIVLMHHHPMPIAELEFKAKSTWQRIRGLTEDDRFLMLRNAGTVMRHLTTAGIHLVLHGHRHHQGYAQVAFPQASVESSHKMTIVAAGSLGMGPARTHHFSVVDVRPPGGIQVEEWKLAGFNFERQSTRRLVDEDDLRTERWKQARARNLSMTNAIADVIHDWTEISPAGDGFYRRSYKGLRAKSGVDSLQRIQFSFASKSGYVHPSQEPVVKIANGGNSRDAKFERAALPGPAETDVVPYQRISGNLVFDPPIAAGEKIDVDVEFIVANSYEIVKEFRIKADSRSGGMEHTEYNVRRVPCEKLILVVKRPTEMDSAGCGWRTHVLNPDNEDDWRERTSSSIQTCAVDGSGLYVMAVRKPLPGYRYRVLWDLPSLSVVQSNPPAYAIYDESDLRAGLAIPDNRLKVVEALRRTRAMLELQMNGHFHVGNFASSTVLAFFLFDEDRVQLSRYADSADNDFAWKLDSGMGTPGQALRRRAPVACSPHGDAGEDFYYQRPPYMTKDHRFQFAMPIPYPPSFGEGHTYPILGVLTLESVDADRSLLPLVSGADGNAAAVQPARGTVASWTAKRFVEQLAEQLGIALGIGKSGDPTRPK
jgi:3',5'-cyclic AMP phosphodiesterase CpdA